MLRLLLIIILPAYTSILLSADKFSAENIHIFGMAHLTAWDTQYQDPNVAYLDVNKMLKTVYNGCNTNSTEGEINKFFVLAKQAHYIAQTYLYMDRNFEAAAATVCVHAHLYLINFMNTQQLPEYEYALSLIKNAAPMATDSHIKLWVQKTESLCTEQMKPFMVITSQPKTAVLDKEGEASVADSGQHDETDTTVERQTESGNTQPSDENDKALRVDTTQRTAPLSKKEKARQKQLANQAKQAAERERRQQEKSAVQDVQPTAANDLGAVGARTPKDVTSGEPKGQNPQKKPSAGAASAAGKKKPTPKKSGAAETRRKHLANQARQAADDKLLDQAIAAADAERAKTDEQRNMQQQAVAKTVEEERLKAEAVLLQKSLKHYTALKALEDRTEECAAYIRANHKEIFSCMELIFEAQHENALCFLKLLTRNSCGLDYLKQKLSNHAKFLDADTHDMYLSISLHLLYNNCAVDIVESFIQNLNSDKLKFEQSRAEYAMCLALLVQNDRQHNLAIIIFNSWIDSPSIYIQRGLITILLHLVRKKLIDQDVSDYITGFSRYDSCPFIHSKLGELLEIL